MTDDARPDLVMACPLDPPVVEALERDFTVHRLWEAQDEAAFLAAHEGARFMATDGHHGCSAARMDALPALEVVASYGVGYDAIDVEAASERGVKVTNTPDVLNDCVAELGLGLMIALCRRIPQAHRYVEDGRWPEGPFPLTGELTGAKLGLLGMGRVGREIARRALAFKMEVSYHARSPKPDLPHTYHEDLVAMAREVDWLLVIAPATPATRHIVSREVMEALGPRGSLVNIARGSLVDEAALTDLLEGGALGAAALDVFEDEPRVSARLRGLPDVVLSPHQGSATIRTRALMGDLVVRNLRAHAAGRPLETPVN